MEPTLKSRIIDQIEQIPDDKLHEVLAGLELILAKSALEKATSSKPNAAPVLFPIQASWSSSYYYDDDQEIHALEDGTPIVWERKPIRAISKKQLVKYLDELVAIARNITSDIETAVQIPGVEGQHAWLEIYAPGELDEQISELMTERALDILMESGYDICVSVHEKSPLSAESIAPSA